MDPDTCVKKIQNSILSSDFIDHRDNWKKYTQCFGNNLSPQQQESFEKLKIESWKTFIVEAIKQNRQDKITETINHVIPLNEDFKDWILLTSIKNPLCHKTFGIYFTNSWMNVFILSLHNMFNMIISTIIINKPVNMQQLKINSKLECAKDILTKKYPKSFFCQ